MTIIEFAPRLEAARRRRSRAEGMTDWPVSPSNVFSANMRLALFPFLLLQFTLEEAGRYAGMVSQRSA